MKRLVLARHGHALSNVRDAVSSLPPGEGLSGQGAEEARALGAALAAQRLDLALASELVRTQETVALALGDRPVPLLVWPAWNEIHFGAFEAGPLGAYRGWAWSAAAAEICPGGGESRGAVAARVAGVLEALLRREEETILAIGHALPVRYVLDAVEGRTPVPRIAPVPHALPHLLGEDDVALAASTLRDWSQAPAFPQV